MIKKSLFPPPLLVFYLSKRHVYTLLQACLARLAQADKPLSSLLWPAAFPSWILCLAVLSICVVLIFHRPLASQVLDLSSPVIPSSTTPCSSLHSPTSFSNTVHISSDVLSDHRYLFISLWSLTSKSVSYSQEPNPYNPPDFLSSSASSYLSLPSCQSGSPGWSFSEALSTSLEFPAPVFSAKFQTSMGPPWLPVLCCWALPHDLRPADSYFLGNHIFCIY